MLNEIRLANYLPEAFANADRQQKEIYGRVVVIKDFIENLIAHGKYPRYQFYQHINFQRKKEGANIAEFFNPNHKIIELKNINQLKNNNPAFDFDIWHDINGELSNAISLRERFSPHPYPISTTFHCLSYQFLLLEWFLDILLKAPKSYDAIVCTSTAARTAMLNQFNHIIEYFKEIHHVTLELNARTEVIPLGIDTDKFKPRDKIALRKQLNLPLDSFIILWIGRISPIDKADLLPTLIVIKELIRDNPKKDIKLVLGGNGEPLFIDIINKSIRDFGLADDVILVLPLLPSERHLYHASADVFISPADNIQETFGITPIEAMACGVPQVVSDWDGYRDTVAHGETGFLIPTYLSNSDHETCLKSGVYDHYDMLDHFEFAQSTAMDLKAYKNALQTLLDHPERLEQMGTASRNRALKVYSWEKCIAQYEDLWNSQIEQMKLTPLSSSGQKRLFDLPNFFGSFQHYATQTVTNATMIQLSERGRDCITGTEKLLNAYKGMNNISSPLLLEVLNILFELRNVSIGDLINQLDVVDYSGDQVFRHIMWLKKYYYIDFLMLKE